MVLDNCWPSSMGTGSALKHFLADVGILLSVALSLVAEMKRFTLRPKVAREVQVSRMGGWGWGGQPQPELKIC